MRCPICKNGMVKTWVEGDPGLFNGHWDWECHWCPLLRAEADEWSIIDQQMQVEARQEYEANQEAGADNSPSMAAEVRTLSEPDSFEGNE